MLARSNPPPPPTPETATDLADLERLLDAKRPPKIVVEELSSAHLELEEDEELALDNDDILESMDPDTRIEVEAYVPEEARPTPIPVEVAFEPSPADDEPATLVPTLSTTAPAPAAAAPEPIEDLASTVQGVPAPVIASEVIAAQVIAPQVIPEAPKTSPVPLELAAANIAATKRNDEDDEHNAEERVNFTQPFRRPSSIAPVAIDLAPQPQPQATPRPAARPVPMRVDSTLPMPSMSARHAQTVITRIPPPKTNLVPWVIAASIIGLFLAAGGVVAAVATSSPEAPRAVAAVDAPRPAPRTADVTSAKTAVSDEPQSASSIGVHGEKIAEPAPASTEPVSVNALPTVAAPAPVAPAPAAAPKPVHTASAPVAPAASPTSKTLVAAPAPAPSPVAPPAVTAAPAPAPKPVATTGVVRVPPPLVVIVVDGQHRRVVNGEVVLGCGTHKIRAGMSEQVANVPCGGSISL